MPPFHLAFPVRDLAATRRFYHVVLGLPIGRESDHWIDFDFEGHQLTAHLAPEECRTQATNAVDGEQVPVRHFGLVMAWDEWEALALRLEAREISFLIRPTVRFEGLPGEQGTFFVRDPSGNALEFKAFRDPERLFARQA